MGSTSQIQYHRSAMGRPLLDGAVKAELASVQGVQLALLSHVEGEHATYVWKNLLLSLWIGESTLNGLASYDQNFQPFLARNPRGVSSINLVVPGKYAVPGSEVRREFSRFTAQYGPLIAATAIVIPGTGFLSSAVRGVITALTIANPRGLKMHVFENTRAVADWLPTIHSERTGVVISSEELTTLLDSVEHTAA